MKDYEQEIIDLHIFFEHWLGGRLEKSEEAFNPLEKALATSFNIVGPDGIMTARNILMVKLYEAHNSRPDLTITIKNVQLHHEDERSLTASYEEWQRINETETARISSALFLKREQLLWQHVHETWLAQSSRR